MPQLLPLTSLHLRRNTELKPPDPLLHRLYVVHQSRRRKLSESNLTAYSFAELLKKQCSLCPFEMGKSTRNHKSRANRHANPSPNPMLRPTSHPLLEGPSHRAGADAHTTLIRREDDAFIAVLGILFASLPVYRRHARLIVPEDLSVVLFDADTLKPFASVIRRFSNSTRTLEWMKGVKDGPGQLVQIGWTTGARSNPKFDAARNLPKKKEDISEADKENAYRSAYFWCRVQLLHTLEVGSSIAAFYNRPDIPRLDPNWPASRQTPNFGSGCLVMTERYFCPVHRETQPHEWVALWTMLPNGTDPKGGYFTSLATGWQTPPLPGSFPISTRQVLHEDDQTMNQQGIAFVTSNKLPTVYAEFAGIIFY
ncbi:hypothetical protein BKA70DRAFT_1231516 [Coprinopsis sp. MPI-PUGE-AT-0042]|nr:hypothetical protein BKA70DRAFT_1231516 [Coprinopsis sp. MPI-PUGE-AT-0042]